MVLKLSRGSLSQLDLDLVLSPNQVEAGPPFTKLNSHICPAFLDNNSNFHWMISVALPSTVRSMENLNVLIYLLHSFTESLLPNNFFRKGFSFKFLSKFACHNLLAAKRIPISSNMLMLWIWEIKMALTSFTLADSTFFLKICSSFYDCYFI